MTTQTSAPTGQSAKDRAAQVAGTAREQTAQVAGTAREQALDVAHDAAAQAKDLFGDPPRQVRQQTDTQREHLTALLDEFTGELEQMADAGGGSGTATTVVREAAQRLRTVRDYLGGGSDVGTDLRSFARRRPGAFILGAVVAGVVAGRVTRGAAAVHSENGASGTADVTGERASKTFPGNDYGDGDVGSATGSRFGTATGNGAVNPTGYPQTEAETPTTSWMETPIAREVAVEQDYVVPAAPRTLDEEQPR